MNPPPELPPVVLVIDDGDSMRESLSMLLRSVGLQKICRANQISLHAEGSDSAQGSIDSCVANEQEAREQIIKAWASYAAADRIRCIQSGAYLPSYVEWLTCIQIAGDALKLRADQPAGTVGAGASDAGRRAGNTTRQCQVTRSHEHGSIDWIIAC